ncbi:MAG: hypothetical protein ACYTEZ_16155 [Planctomycetota bacterium]|jgi:hypothetical protein
MSVFHFKGQRVALSGRDLEIRFYPDYVDLPEVSGFVVINLDSWEYRIVRHAEPEKPASDERCVLALIHRLKKETSPETVDDIYFVA